LTRIFEENIKENEFCMDIVDSFNYTRIKWSKGYKCNYKSPDTVYFKIISGLASAMTIAFYTLVKLFGVKEEKKFVPMQRKKSTTYN
jgi:hypothetical protein